MTQTKRRKPKRKAAAQPLNDLTERTERFELSYRLAHPGASAREIRDAGIRFFLSRALDEEDNAAFNLVASLSLRADADENRVRQQERKLDLEERKVRLRELEAARATPAGAAPSGPATPEEQERRLKEIFGLTGNPG